MEEIKMKASIPIELFRKKPGLMIRKMWKDENDAFLL